ncbi:ABC transporter substrate-binding protein [Aquabacter sp. P-9]|uniref:ABC transporter substrate-binding protein n=1 Tax=Aquabacter sediminis TaxID=3029197 RepID=UPI00237DF018|nr:ABC transporter substrate-binding protein [Aquabacter sp. P-9]MDE1568325.1 ABC transporter substrate-binding protein [Aquabacter sp. P-9]
MTRIAMTALALVLALGPAAAQDKKPIRIAVINDQTGIFSETGGMGSVVGARLAIEDFGGEINGRKIELVVQDHQNKPDIAAAIVRKGIEVEGYDLIADGASSAAGLAINEVAKSKGAIFVVSGPAAPDFSGKGCSPTTFHFTYDTYALANGTAKALVKQGGNSWFFITADYAFGHAIQRDVTKFVEEAGGKVLGSVKYPTGSQDLSSYLLQAQASKAKIIGLANAGVDTINSLKQGREFGIVQGGQNFAGLLVFISDVHAMGLDVAQGLVLTTSFYWDLNDSTRKLATRFSAQMNGKKPTMVHAGVYSGVRHYLAAVKATGTTESAVVAKAMHDTPVNDAYNTNVAIRPDGRVLHDMYLMKVKAPAESKYPYDYYSLLTTTPGKDAFRPLAQSECPLVQKPN